MLIRISPLLTTIKGPQLGYVPCKSVFLQSAFKMSTVRNASSPLERQLKRSPSSTILMRSSSLVLYQNYATKQPELPTKQELEKYFFKITVVIWDLMLKLSIWAWGMCRTHIINNPTVQAYWKNFNQKLEEARKN